MSNYGREEPFFKRLATSFNALLGIAPGFFGSPDWTGIKGAGVLRAEARLKAHRQAQKDRLGPIYDRKGTMTRQIRRQMERKAAKEQRQADAAALRQMSFNTRRELGLITGGIA